ncbi:MAG: hypothetical protein AAF416_08255 [Pseudomonadota bacterium]
MLHCNRRPSALRLATAACLAAILPIEAASQSIYGQIVSRKQAVEDLELELVCNGRVVDQVETDEDGYYRLELSSGRSSRCEVEIDYRGEDLSHRVSVPSRGRRSYDFEIRGTRLIER